MHRLVPPGTDFTKYSDRTIDRAHNRLNQPGKTKDQKAKETAPYPIRTSDLLETQLPKRGIVPLDQGGFYVY